MSHFFFGANCCYQKKEVCVCVCGGGGGGGGLRGVGDRPLRLEKLAAPRIYYYHIRY